MTAEDVASKLPLDLVTGGAGFLGSAIVREVLAAGRRARVLALPDEKLDNLAGLDVEVARGDVRNRSDCEAAVAGCSRVYHAAAVYRDYMPDPTPLYEVNMRGTFNMLEASRRAGVEHVVYTASVVALGRPKPGELGDEDTAYEAWDIDFPYSRSKYHSRRLAEDFSTWGMDVRVVCPGMIFGPGDVGPTPSGQLILNVAHGKAPGWTEGGCGYVDVRDAAQVHVLASEKGRAGRRYLAVGHNLHNRDFLSTVSRIAGRSHRMPKIPTQVARLYLKGMAKFALIRGDTPMMTSEMFDYSCRPVFFNNRRSQDELGMIYRPITETISDAIAYFREVGQIG
ncbi:MAG: NAD-dependent epimerase/dehydratase family protein [Nannocystaceae bacterium]